MGYPNTDPKAFPYYPPTVPPSDNKLFDTPMRLHPFVNITEIHWPEIIRPICYGWWQCGCGQGVEMPPALDGVIARIILAGINRYFDNWVWEGQNEIMGKTWYGGWKYRFPVWEPPLGLLFVGDCKKKDGSLYKANGRDIEPPFYPHGFVLADPKPDFASMIDVKTACPCPDLMGDQLMSPAQIAID